MNRARAVLLFLVVAAFHFIVAAALFFGLLSLWGLVLAPRFHLSSSSLVIFFAFALSVAGSSLIYKALVRLRLRRAEQPRKDPLTKS